MKQQIDNAGVFGVLAAQKFRQQIGKLRPDAGKRRDCGKEGIEYGGTHGLQNRGRLSPLQ